MTSPPELLTSARRRHHHGTSNHIPGSTLSDSESDTQDFEVISSVLCGIAAAEQAMIAIDSLLNASIDIHYHYGVD